MRLEVGGILRVDPAVDGPGGKESIPGVQPLLSEIGKATGSGHHWSS
jgi:hypothetical protein